MAYTIITIDAFNKGVDEEGWDYQTAEDLIRKLQAAAVGRFFMDELGNAIYESRFSRQEVP